MIKKQFFSTVDKKQKSKQVHKSKFIDQQTSSDTPKKTCFKSKFIDWLKQLPLDQRYLAVKVHAPGLANKIQQKLIQLDNNVQIIDNKKDINFNKKLSQKQSKQILQSIVLITDGEQFFSNIGFDFIYVQNPQRLYELLVMPLNSIEKQAYLTQQYQIQHISLNIIHKQISLSQNKQDMCIKLINYLRQQIFNKFQQNKSINLQQQRNRKKEFSTYWRSLNEQYRSKILLLFKQDIKSLQIYLNNQKIYLQLNQLQKQYNQLIKLDKNQFCNRIFKCKLKKSLTYITNYHELVYKIWKQQMTKKKKKINRNYQINTNNNNVLINNNNKNNHSQTNKTSENINNSNKSNNTYNNNIQLKQKTTIKSSISSNLLISSTNKSIQQPKTIKKITNIINNNFLTKQTQQKKVQQLSKISNSTINTTNKRNKRNKNRGKKSNSAQSKQTKATSNKFTDQGEKQQNIVCQYDREELLINNNDNKNNNKIQDIPSQTIQINENLQSKISISTNHSTNSTPTTLPNSTQQTFPNKQTFDPSVYIQHLPSIISSSSIIKTQLLSKISSNIQQYSDQINQQANMFYDRRFIAYERIQFMLNIWEIPTKLFGSCASGITIKNSDIDIAVDSKILQYFINVPQPLRLKAALQQLSFFFTQQPFITSMKLISTASIPLIKMTLNTSLPFIPIPSYPIPLQYIETMNRQHLFPGQIQIDLTIQTKNKHLQSNHLGVISTNWINKQLQQIKTLHTIIILIKNYLTMMNLNVTYEGGLNTYSMICLIVAYIKQNKLESETNIAMNLKKICYFYAYEFNQSQKGIDINNVDNIFYDKIISQPKLAKSFTQSYSSIHNNNNNNNIELKTPQLSHSKSNIIFCQADLQIKDPLNNGKNMTKNCYSFPEIKKMFKKIYDECFQNYTIKMEKLIKQQCQKTIKQSDMIKNSIKKDVGQSQIKSFVQQIVIQCKDSVVVNNNVNNPFFTLFQ